MRTAKGLSQLLYFQERPGEWTCDSENNVPLWLLCNLNPLKSLADALTIHSGGGDWREVTRSDGFTAGDAIAFTVYCYRIAKLVQRFLKPFLREVSASIPDDETSD
jgi:hypothetical protein